MAPPLSSPSPDPCAAGRSSSPATSSRSDGIRPTTCGSPSRRCRAITAPCAGPPRGGGSPTSTAASAPSSTAGRSTRPRSPTATRWPSGSRLSWCRSRTRPKARSRVLVNSSILETGTEIRLPPGRFGLPAARASGGHRSALLGRPARDRRRLRLPARSRSPVRPPPRAGPRRAPRRARRRALPRRGGGTASRRCTGTPAARRLPSRSAAPWCGGCWARWARPRPCSGTVRATRPAPAASVTGAGVRPSSPCRSSTRTAPSASSI